MIPAAVLPSALREHLGMRSDDPSDVDALAVAATGTAEGVCNIGPIVYRAATERVRATGYGALMLTGYPVASVSSVVAVSGESVSGPFDVDANSGIVRPTVATCTPGASYLVTYQAGRWATAVEVDPDIALAVCIIAKHLHETRRGQGSRPGALGDSEPVLPYGFAVPRRADQLLAPYRRSLVT